MTCQQMKEVDNAIEVQFEKDEFTVISACRERTGKEKGDWSIYSVVVVEAIQKKQIKKSASKKSESRMPVLVVRSRTVSRERRMSPIQQRRYSALDRYRSLPPGTASIDISASRIRQSSVSVRRRSGDEGQALSTNNDVLSSSSERGVDRGVVLRRASSAPIRSGSCGRHSTIDLHHLPLDGESRTGTFKRDKSLVRLRRQLSINPQERKNRSEDSSLRSMRSTFASRFLKTVPE